MDGMVKVRLQVPRGDLVTEVWMLPYQRWPQVVTWGTRTFLRTDTMVGQANGVCVPVYEECIAHHVPSVHTVARVHLSTEGA